MKYNIVTWKGSLCQRDECYPNETFKDFGKKEKYVVNDALPHTDVNYNYTKGNLELTWSIKLIKSYVLNLARRY